MLWPAFLLLITAVLCAQELPRIEARNLLGQAVNLPEASAGRPAILVIGFSHASQNQTKPWDQRLEHEFDAAKVAVYPIAVLQAVPRLVRGMVVHGIKGGTPEDERGRYLLVYHHEDELKQAAGFQQPDDAYLLLLDPAGNVHWRFHGPVSDGAVIQLKTEVQDIEAGAAK